MATEILTDCKIYVGQYNISTDLNTIKLVSGAQLKEDTAFGATYQTMKGGGALIKTQLNGSGFVQSGVGKVEDIIESVLGVDGTPITVSGILGGSSSAGNAGDSCRFFCGGFDMYDAGAKIGDMHQLNFSAKNSSLVPTNPLIRGTIMEDGKTARTTASNTVTQTLGAVGSTQKLYCIIHLLNFTGTDVTFTVKSAVTDFATITTRATSQQFTTAGSQYLTPVAGAFTDTFWRVFWTTVGGLTSFNAVISLGIL